MLTWRKFVESKLKDLEGMEEKLHKDLDHDGEKGESEEHKKKVFGDEEDDDDEDEDAEDEGDDEDDEDEEE